MDGARERFAILSLSPVAILGKKGFLVLLLGPTLWENILTRKMSLASERIGEVKLANYLNNKEGSRTEAMFSMSFKHFLINIFVFI